MTSFKILGQQLTQEEIEAVKTLVGQAGANEPDVIDAIAAPDPEVDEIIVVLGTAATCADASLETNLAGAAGGARRAIWVWPEGANPAALPPAAAKYSYSVIPWDSHKLRAAAADDDVTCFENSVGEPLPEVPTERNLCVDEKVKPK